MTWLPPQVINPGGHKWRLLLVVSSASFLGCIDFSIGKTVVPDIQADLHAPVDQSQWIISIFLMVLRACMVAAGVWRISTARGFSSILEWRCLACSLSGQVSQQT
jgi:MFS family permease